MSGWEYDTPPVGRQPKIVKWVPSKPRDPWHGTVVGGQENPLAIEGGERFTVEQQRWCTEHGVDPQVGPGLLVKRQATGDEIWRSMLDMPPVLACECPVTGLTRADGKVQIVSPAGSKKFVFPDGWAHRPYRRPLYFSRKEQR